MQDNQHSAPIFRDGRWIAAGAIVGALLITAACFSSAFTAFELNEENWKTVVLTRMVFAFLTIFGGLFAIAWGILRPMRMLICATLVCGLIAAAFAYYPCGAQLLAGAEVRAGEIQKIKIPGVVTNFRMLPESRTVSSERKQPLVEVCLRLNDGTWYETKCQRRDLKDSGLGETLTKGQHWKLTSLRYLNRMISAQQIRPERETD